MTYCSPYLKNDEFRTIRALFRRCNVIRKLCTQACMFQFISKLSKFESIPFYIYGAVQFGDHYRSGIICGPVQRADGVTPTVAPCISTLIKHEVSAKQRARYIETLL